MSLNVNPNVADSFYRYKMPALVAKVEGKGNGIKTVIVNITDIAKALGRPSDYIIKFFGFELGSPALIDLKADRYIVNGEHAAARLQELLYEFIKKFVLCINCGNPETKLSISKTQKVEASCLACGQLFQLNTKHKLTSHILKTAHVEKAKEDAKTKKKKKPDPAQADSKEAESSPPATPTKPSKQKPAPVDETEAVEDDEWCEDTTEEAVDARAKVLAGKVAALASTDDLDRSSTERLELLFNFVTERATQAKFPTREVVAEAERLECKDKACMVLVEVLLDSDTEVLSRAKTHAKLFRLFLADNPKAQKYMLGALEKLAERYSKVTDKFANILKGFYDLDILDEEAILEWGQKVSKKYVSKELSAKLHEKAEPVLAWLREAESEESGDSDEDENTGVTFAPAPEPVNNTERDRTTATAAVPASTAGEPDEDEIDIDAI